jgi:hypothetical protein
MKETSRPLSLSALKRQLGSGSLLLFGISVSTRKRRRRRRRGTVISSHDKHTKTTRDDDVTRERERARL